MLGFKRFETVAVTIRGIPVSRENQKTSVQSQTTNRKSNHRSGNVDRGLGGLKSAKSFARQKHTLNKICTKTLTSALESWHEACTTLCELGVGRTFQTSSYCLTSS
jgi:hypothetical protein